MKNKKIIFGTILFLFAISGFCNISHAWTDDFTLPPLSYAYYYLGYLHDGDIIKINEIDSSDIITVYIMNDEQYDELTWEYLIKWEDMTYLSNYDYDITVDDSYYIVFRNKGILFSRTVQVDMLVEYAKITITSPNYDTFVSGYNYIYWTSTGSFDYVKIELYKDGYFLETITGLTYNDGSYSWYIYNDDYIDDSTYQIKITDYYEPTTYDYSSYFTIESESKSITITLPTSYTIISSGYNDITWTSTGSIDYVIIEMYKDGYFLETITSWTYNDGSHSWYIYDDDYTDDSDYQIKISDWVDDSIYDYSDYFTIECEIDDPYEPYLPTDYSYIVRNIFFFVIIPVIIIGAVIVGYVIFKKKHPKEPLIQIKEIPKITYCPECGIKITDVTKDYCSRCGSKIIRNN